MPVAVLLTSLRLDFGSAVRQAARLGFAHADTVAVADRAAGDREILAETGLMITCASLGRNLPVGCSLDAADVTARQRALALVKRQLADAAQLGATRAYLVPEMDASPAALDR